MQEQRLLDRGTLYPSVGCTIAWVHNVYHMMPSLKTTRCLIATRSSLMEQVFAVSAEMNEIELNRISYRIIPSQGMRSCFFDKA